MRFFRYPAKAVLITLLCYAVVLACFNLDLFVRPTVMSLALLASAVAVVIFGLTGKKLPGLRKLALLAGAIFGTTVFITRATEDTGQLGYIMAIGTFTVLSLIFFEEIMRYLPVIGAEVFDELHFQIARPFRSWHKEAPSFAELQKTPMSEPPTAEWTHMTELFGSDIVRDLEIPVSN